MRIIWNMWKCVISQSASISQQTMLYLGNYFLLKHFQQIAQCAVTCWHYSCVTLDLQGKQMVMIIFQFLTRWFYPFNFHRPGFNRLLDQPWLCSVKWKVCLMCDDVPCLRGGEDYECKCNIQDDTEHSGVK